MLKGYRIQKVKQALLSGELEKLQTALEGVDKLDFRLSFHEDGLSASYPILNLALRLGHSHFLPYLLEQGAPLDHRVEIVGQPSCRGATLLPFVQNDEDLLMLLKAGLSWHVVAGEGHPDLVLHQAARHGWHQSIEWLFKCGEHIEIKNQDGETPLQVLVGSTFPISRADKLKTLHGLLAQSPRLEVKDQQGWSLLHRAAHHFPAAVVPLIKAGVDPSLVDSSNWRAFDYLRHRVQVEKNREQDSLIAFLYLNGLIQNKPSLVQRSSSPSL